jgi:hypothetical protein
MRATRGPIPAWNLWAIPLQVSNLVRSEYDKITPAERSDHSPDPFGGGGWGVGENLAAGQ